MTPAPLELVIVLAAILAGALLGLAIVAIFAFLMRRRRVVVATPLPTGTTPAPAARPARQPKWY